MTLYKLAGCRRLGVLTSNTAKGHLVRWQSSGAARKGGGLLKKVVLSLALTGTGVGGILAYSNYNPVFKNQVNERVPGFAAVSDKATDTWVDITDYFNPKAPSTKAKDAYVIEHNQAKVKARLDQLKKATPAAESVPPDSAAADQKEAKKGEKSASDRKERKPKPEKIQEKKLDKKKAKAAGKEGEKSAGDEMESKSKSEKTQEKVSETKSEHRPDKKKMSEPKSSPIKEQPSEGSEAKKDTKEVTKTPPLKVSVDAKEKDKGDQAASGDAGVAPSPPPPSSQSPPEKAASLPPAALPAAVVAPAEPKVTVEPTDEDFVLISSKPERSQEELKMLESKVELLQHQLKESEAQQAKLAQALESQKKSLEESAEKRLDQALRESEAKHKRQLIEETNKIADNYNSMLREQLRLESESQLMARKEALENQAKQLNLKWSSELELRLSMQEGFYQTELARAFARLGGLHATVDGVLSAGQRTVKLQTLRNSCDTLSDTLDRIDSASDTVDRYTIGAEVASLRRAAEKDTFIATVLDSIPTQAVTGVGIQSMEGLRERFAKVKRICRRVALVPETGGGLGTYAISYLQSLLTISAWFPTSTLTDLSEMHVYQLLHQADARLRRGDLEGAILYMNHLKGDARNVARDWLVDARLYLETRQAVQLVQTYMAASNASPVLNLDS